MSHAAVEARLRQLDRGTLAAFVADLWAARGYETTREDGAVVATSGGESLRIHPVTRSWRGRLPGRGDVHVADADVVVAPHGGDLPVPAGARVVDAAALREMLWYALDAETRETLCVRHFGAPPADLTVPRSPLADAARRVAALRPSLPHVSRASAGVAVALLLVVGIGAVAGVVFSGGAAPDAQGTDTTPAAVPTVTTTAASSEPMPPGVTEGGIANLSALAAAHDRVLAGRSYSLWLDSYRPETLNGPRIQRDMDIDVEGERYLLETELVEGADRVPVLTAYYNGDDWHVARIGDRRTDYRFVPGDRAPPFKAPDPFELRRTLVTRYLSTPETRLAGQVTEEGRRLYRLVGTGQPTGFDRAFREYEVTALVDRRGLVHSISVSYTLDEGAAPTVQFEATYGRFGNVSVVPPTWYDRRFADNVTATPAGSPPPTADSPAPPSTEPLPTATPGDGDGG